MGGGGGGYFIAISKVVPDSFPIKISHVLESTFFFTRFQIAKSDGNDHAEIIVVLHLKDRVFSHQTISRSSQGGDG